MERSPIGTVLPDKIAALPKSAGTFARGCLHKYESTMGTKFTWDYDRGETVADAVIHILGIAIAIGGAAVLAVIAVHQGDITELTAIAIYLVAVLAMFGFSAAYNLWPVSPVKWWLRRLDHSAIYLLIAATYTAFLLPMRGTAPNVVLIVIWSVAIAGIAIKLLWPGRFDRTAVGLYLSMGWSGIFTIGPITAALAPATLLLIGAGGVLYSVGVIFHAWGSLRFQNAIWHGFVLVAALCHYAAVFTSLVT
jgi:hemolysin III